MTISYTKLGRRVFPSTATLNSQSPPPSQTTTPPSDSSRMLLNCYQRSSFAAAQAAICQPTNLQPRLTSGFEAAPSLAATRASPSSQASTTPTPWRSSPVKYSRCWNRAKRDVTTASAATSNHAISSDYAVNAELPAAPHTDPPTPSARSADAAKLSARRSPCSSARSTPAHTGGLPPQRRGEGFS